MSEGNSPCMCGDEECRVWLEHGYSASEDAAHRIAGQAELVAALRALQLQALQSPDLLATEWGQEALALTKAALQPLSQAGEDA
jgi:hypothetical protein